MNLIIDIGNTLTKLALFENKDMCGYAVYEGCETEPIVDFCEKNKEITHCILSAVKEYPEAISDFLRNNYTTIFFDSVTRLPIINGYETPLTLGKDRIAAAVGALNGFKNCDVLSIDAGTAITYDFIDASGTYLGGGISPGIRMRFKALHTFTGKLPLIEMDEDAPLIGSNTRHSIASGVLNGTIAEVEGIIDRYQAIYPDIKIILTGGDHNYFDKRLKVKTFAAPNLVLEGLNLILNFNIE